MKLNNPVSAAPGSFASPEKLAAQMRDQQDVKKKADTAKEATDAVAKEMAQSAEEWPMNEAVPMPEADATPARSQPMGKTPIERLKELGIEPVEDDFHSLIFRGYIEKEVEVIKNPMTGKPLTAVLRALTSEEVDAVDELLVEQIESTKMSNEGLEIRRSVWLMSIAVRKLAGKPLVKKSPVDENGVVDIKAEARARRAVLIKLNPFLLSRMIQIHSVMVSAFNELLSGHGSEDFLKKS